ncbi:glycosyltransferase family 2 protein [Thalassococcus sp. S3]|uniref:glycosyltransferase family 2 protein n=1 Tax=Thalassococcus sp. S3 TaxID=2017482 RepID=UPI0010240976|nr:glycosyltransferase family 2 protein [Thalassococcus sp. S3]QBF34080.1 glycosyl transferase family 2 [Thalassococcus sp. S3]
MTSPPVSVVVVSRGRPKALTRCLTGISQLLYAPFEIIVVACTEGLRAVRRLPIADDLKLVVFDEANISQARNMGVAEAAGEIVAFIDDDAVPEPAWLTYLIGPFSDPDVSAVGGFVRGRNGISWQWQAQSVDHTGETASLDVDSHRATILTAQPGQAVKTEGTNMAIRRSILAEMGGFDPNFHYFHDETDLNLRLAARRLQTAIAPLAEVHHGFQENAIRTRSRVPKDLHQIGASWAVFLNKHCPEDMRSEIWIAIRRRERARALRHMVTGALEPRDVGRLMRSLDAGHAEGLTRPPIAMPALPRSATAFQPFPSNTKRQHVVLAGRSWSAARLRAEAKAHVQAGRITTLFLFSPTALFHHVVFESDGYWCQTGGTFGRSLRNDPLFRLTSFTRRVRREKRRYCTMRGTA